MVTLVKRFIKDESAATALEYGLMIALISIVVVAAASAVFANMAVKFNKISNTLS